MILGKETMRLFKMGANIFLRFNKVNAEFISPNRVVTYFHSLVRFTAYLKKMCTIKSDKNTCGVQITPTHYLFYRCLKMLTYFPFNRDHTLRSNLWKALLDSKDYSSLCAIYIKLRTLYSFIKHKF